MSESDKADYEKSVEALRARLDPGSKAMVVMQHRMRVRTSVISSVAWRRHSVECMDMTPCFLRPEMHCSMPSSRRA